MRVLTCFLLLATLPLQAKEPTEQERLAWYNYQLAVAEAPGDLRSDQRMAQILNLLTLSGPADGAAVSEPR